MVDITPGGTEIVDRSGNGKGVDINSDIADIDGAMLTLKDDGVTFLDLGGGSAIPVVAFIYLSSTNNNANGLFRVSVGSVTVCDVIWRANAAVLDGALGVSLTGTTGIDGHLTVLASIDGRVYLENRLGVPIKVKMFAMNVIG